MFRWLFDDSGFVTRSECGDWQGTLKILNQLFNGLIAGAYMAIPLILILAIYKSKNKDNGIIGKLRSLRFVLFCFVMFILFCGFTHINDVIVFYWAPYRFFTLIYGITAMFSVGTVIVLIINLPWILSLKTYKEYKALVEDRELKIKQKDLLEVGLKEQLAKMEVKLIALQQKREEKDWYMKTSEEIASLRNMLTRGKATINAANSVDS